jgi:hypothetical protein
VIWLATAPLVSRTVKVVATFAAGVIIVILVGAPWLGWLEQPMARWWFGQQPGSAGAFPVAAPVVGTVPAPQSGLQPMVSDVQRYLLAVGAGFTGPDIITAVAVSIAEDGSGNPAALSGKNFDGSRDLGLWQINSGWWPRFGGQEALTNPVTNALAAHYVFTVQGWCAWSTYNASCGKGHNSAYLAFLDRARSAAEK